MKTNGAPEFKDFFPEDFPVKEAEIGEFKVGDIVKFTPAFSFMKKKYGEELHVFCIIEYPNKSGIGVVAGEKVCGYWMVYNGEKEEYRPPANTNLPDWDFWRDGPTTFDSRCFEKV